MVWYISIGWGEFFSHLNFISSTCLRSFISSRSMDSGVCHHTIPLPNRFFWKTTSVTAEMTNLIDSESVAHV